MGMHVDEPGRDDEPPCLNHAPSLGTWHGRPDPLDPIAANRKIAQECGIAGAVDDFSALDQQVKRLVGLRVGGGIQAEGHQRPEQPIRSFFEHLRPPS